MKDIDRIERFDIFEDYFKDYKHTNLYLYLMNKLFLSEPIIFNAYNNFLNFLTYIDGEIYVNGINKDNLNKLLKIKISERIESKLVKLICAVYENKDKSDDFLINGIKEAFLKNEPEYDDFDLIDITAASYRLILESRHGLTDDYILEKIYNRIYESNIYNFGYIKDVFESLDELSLEKNISILSMSTLDNKIFSSLGVTIMNDLTKLDIYKLSIVIGIDIKKLMKSIFLNIIDKSNSITQRNNYFIYLMGYYRYRLFIYGNNKDFISDLHKKTCQIKKKILEDYEESKETVLENISIIDNLLDILSNESFVKGVIPSPYFEEFYEDDTSNFIKKAGLYSRKYFFSKKYNSFISNDININKFKEEVIRRAKDTFSISFIGTPVEIMDCLKDDFDCEEIDEDFFTIYNYVRKK